MKELLLVCLGGAVGSGARHLVASGIMTQAVRVHHPEFPWGTLTVNAIGSFLLAGLFAYGGDAGPSPTMRLLLGTGVLGGFTTYSTFNWETMCLLKSHTGTAIAYMTCTLVACLLCGTLGVLAARALTP